MTFTEWRQNKETPIVIQSYRDQSDLRVMIEATLKMQRLQANTCYDNAYKLCKKYPDINYVLGRVYGDRTVIDHAWNEWNGIHFDLTREIFAPSTLKEFRWAMITRFCQEEIRKLAALEIAPTVYDVFQVNVHD